MIVYHGSINTIEKPIVSAGRDNLDFGKGFYITDIREQAETWGSRLAERKDAVAIVNVYDIDLEYALAELAKHQPNNQFCITNQNLIEECLTFKESIQC